MTNFPVGVIPAVDFERAREVISELSNHPTYDDWLDSRYGRFMGLSLGGADAGLVTVALDDFLNWCGESKMRPSEATLDVFADHLSLRGPPARRRTTSSRHRQVREILELARKP